MDSVLPVLELVFDMPETLPREGSVQWVANLETTPTRITFAQAALYPTLMRALVRAETREGDDDGLVRLRAGERIPDTHYDPTDVAKVQLLQKTNRSVHLIITSAQLIVTSV